jgi:tRNA A37 threonylcarbamoyltransferase TsaD
MLDIGIGNALGKFARHAGFSHPGGPNDAFNELAEISRILKIGVLRYDVKLEPYPYNVE